MGARFRLVTPDFPASQPYRLTRRPEERVEILGARMDLVKPQEVFHFVAGRIAAGERCVVANHNLHSLALCRREPAMRAFFLRADLVEVDSTPLIAWARLIGHRARPFHRSTYLDWRDVFWSLAEREGWRVFMLGGSPEVSAKARARIQAEHPALKLAARSGYFDAALGSPENAAVVAEVNAFAPQVLLVGMGMPRQELWVLQNLDRLSPCAVFTVGGAFDYEAGAQVPCPRWLGRLGLEWLFRLLMNPRRLFERYCLEPWRLAPLALRDLVGLIERKRRRSNSAARIEQASGLL